MIPLAAQQAVADGCVIETRNGSGWVHLSATGATRQTVEDAIARYLDRFPAFGYQTRFCDIRELDGRFCAAGERWHSCD